MAKIILIGLLLTLFLVGFVSAGFASSFLEKIDGKLTMVGEQGQVKEYFIYPQNMDEKEDIIKIQITSGSEMLVEPLEDSYTIPQGTESDEFPIKLLIKIPEGEPGMRFSFGYSVLSSQESDETGMVKFSPVGYEKNFDVMIKEPDKKPIPFWIYLAIAGFISVLIVAFIVLKKGKGKQEQSNDDFLNQI